MRSIKEVLESGHFLIEDWLRAREYFLTHGREFSAEDRCFLNSIMDYGKHFHMTERQMKAFIQTVNRAKNE